MDRVVLDSRKESDISETLDSVQHRDEGSQKLTRRFVSRV